jgi:hypothetical protein
MSRANSARAAPLDSADADNPRQVAVTVPSGAYRTMTVRPVHVGPPPAGVTGKLDRIRVRFVGDGAGASTNGRREGMADQLFDDLMRSGHGRHRASEDKG